MKMDNLEVKVVENREQWEDFTNAHEEVNFLQSWNWAVFHENSGRKAFRFGLFEGDKLIGIALAIKEVARRGVYFTIAGGPVPFTGEHTPVLMEGIRRVAREEKCDFIRLRPQEVDSEKTREMAKRLGLKKAPLYLTADLTLKLDLSLSEEEIMKQMRKNTRYEVRKAEREGVEVRISKDPGEVKEFHREQVDLAKKQHFVPFSYEFFYEQFKALAADDRVAFFHAYKGGKLLASAFIIFYNQEAVYHYGISTPENRNWPGAYACQWAAIKEAKRRGLKHYNLWGIAPKGQEKHRFGPLSVFKRGFGGEEVQYLPAHDLQTSWKYPIIRTFELIRKRVRRV